MPADPDIAPVALVVPPFFSVARPHLGVGLLKAGLARRRIMANVYYANLVFEERIGSLLPEWLAVSSPVNQLMGEWVFAHLIGRKSRDELDGYVDDVQAKLASGHPGTPAELRRLRDAAEEFVDEVAEEVVQREPEIVGFSSCFQQTCAALAIAKRVKELRPGIRVCFGGANCEGEMGRELLSLFDFVDNVFSGECDLAFPEIVQTWLAGGEPLTTGDYEITWSPGGSSRSFVHATPVKNLNEIPLPDFDDFFAAINRENMRGRINPALVLETSRGCWWGAKHHCTFCGLNTGGMTYRMKEPARVIAEIDALSDRYGVTDFQAVDNILAARGMAEAIADSQNPGSPRRFFFEVKANLGFRQLEVLVRAGITHVQPGIESLDDHVLKLMNKGVSAAQNIAFIRSCAELGVQPSWNLLFGFPRERNEPYQRMMELIPLLEHLPAPGSWSPVRIDRFSPFFDQAHGMGFTDVRPFPSYSAIYGVGDESAAKLAYYFFGTPAEIVDLDVLESFLARVEDWQQRYASAGRATVTIVETPEGSVVVDTRGCAAQTFRLLSAQEKAALFAATAPTTIEVIADEWAQRTNVENGYSSREGMLTAARNLIAAGLLVEAGGRVISIVVRPGEEVLDPTEFAPCGQVVHWMPDAVTV